MLGSTAGNAQRGLQLQRLGALDGDGRSEAEGSLADENTPGTDSARRFFGAAWRQCSRKGCPGDVEIRTDPKSSASNQSLSTGAECGAEACRIATQPNLSCT